MKNEPVRYIKNFLITELILLTTVISISILAFILLKSSGQDIGIIIVITIILVIFTFVIAIVRKLDELLIMNKIKVLSDKLRMR